MRGHSPQGIRAGQGVREAQVAVAALHAIAQREGHSCMNTSTAYTVKHIQKGLTPLALEVDSLNKKDSTALGLKQSLAPIKGS